MGAQKKTIVGGSSKTSKKKVAAKRGGTKGKQGICFAIMPFGGWFNDYYTTIYRPAIETAGMKPHRADDLYRPSTIVNDIWAYTRQANIILADLTGKNPNVFYELGLAHALAKPAILIAESMEDVPFDLRSLRVIEYDKNDPNWGETLGEKIVNAIREVLASPLQAVLPAFLDVEPERERATVSEQQKEMLGLRQEIELLRAEVRSRSSSEPRIPTITVEDARDRVLRYLELGMPRSVIISRLAEFGVRSGWVERQIEKYEAQQQLPLTEAEVAGENKPSAQTSKGQKSQKIATGKTAARASKSKKK